MGDLDTFDHILQVSSHHDAMYAYYYMDEDNKVIVAACRSARRFLPYKRRTLF